MTKVSSAAVFSLQSGLGKNTAIERTCWIVIQTSSINECTLCVTLHLLISHRSAGVVSTLEVPIGPPTVGGGGNYIDNIQKWVLYYTIL